MNLQTFLLMRHEIILMIIILVMLAAEIFSDDKKNTYNLSIISIILFAIHTIIGYLPGEHGTLFGKMYINSELTVQMKNILNIGVLIVLLQASQWLRKPENEGKTTEFSLLIYSTLLGMYFMISSGNFLMLFIGLETATIPVATLAAYDKYRNQSSEAGIKLLLSSALSSGILLFGLSMIYAVAGTFYFEQISSNLATMSHTPALLALGMIFFIAGMAFKISLVPFHLWTADVYEGAPVPVTSYLSVVSKGASVFIFTIVLYTVFKSMLVLWTDAVIGIAVATMIIGNLFALRQKNMKRFLAFSSIAQAGFILLGTVAGSQFGMSTVLYFVLIYIFSNLAAFGVVSIISYSTGKESMNDYKGLYNTNPKLSLIMMLALFSLAGIPPVAGFFGKFFLFMASAEQGYYYFVLIAVLNTIISLYYYLLPVKAMFIDTNETPIQPLKSELMPKIALVLCVVGLLVIGFASPVFEYLKEISFGI